MQEVQSTPSMINTKKSVHRGIWLAQSEERAALDLGVMSSSPTLGIEIT